MSLRWPELPVPSGSPVSLRLTPAAARRVRGGHPWVFDTDITRVGRDDGMPGDIAVLYDAKNRLCGVGLFDPSSPIRARVLHAGGGASIEPAFFAARIEAAADARDTLFGDDTDGYRLIHGPGDGLPGVVVDRYADTLVLKLYAASFVPHLRAVLDALVLRCRPVRIVLRTSRAVEDAVRHATGLGDGSIVLGPPLDGPVLFQEHGIVFEAEPVVGQKTGFFLDQRDNRARVEAYVRERGAQRVLNVFAYTGGFSLYAARGGAAEVVSVDIAAPACAAIARNFGHNDANTSIYACAHREVAEDAFAALDAMARAGERFDVVVVDPPSFARRAAEIEGAERAYRRLTGLAMRVLAPGGLAVLASCSSRVTPERFEALVLDAAARVGRPLAVLETTGHAADHPATFDEGRYLKCVYGVG